MKILTKILSHKKELLLISILLFIAGVSHGYNMFHFPYYENDEGTYMAQAWAITQGKLAPYTYWYDHAPAGWILIALWTKLTGGFFTFGASVNSGRVLMLLMHLGTSLLLYYVAKKITGSVIPATIAVLIFSLSPLGIFFQRRVLLDNIMIFWVFLALALLLKDKIKLRHIILSAISFGIAVLTKENAVFFVPAFIYIIYQESHKHHRNFALVKWLSISALIVSLYFIYALLKSEFFPMGFLGNNAPHVSLLETVQYQISRKGGFFLEPNSSFLMNFKEWIKGGFFITVPDPIILIAGTIATILLFGISIKHKPIRYVSLFTISYWLFLLRGGEVIGFYIIPLIPFLALSIAILIHIISSSVLKFPLGKILFLIFVLIILFPFGWYYINHLDVYVKDQTTNQTKAVKWVKQNISGDSIILIDNYAFVDLHTEIPGSFSIERGAQYYWKVDKDPAIKTNLLKNNWRNIDYILVSPQMKYDIYHADLDLVREAYENSTSLEEYPGVGYDIEIRKVNESKSILSKGWNTYKQTFSRPNGEIYDPNTARVTSEGQAYSLLRAVWMDNKEEFDKVWTWSDKNIRLEDKNLFAWLYGQKEEKGGSGIKDKGTATDADQDIALALLFAYKKWGQVDYLTQAKSIIADIWQYETVEIKGKRYIVAGDWASGKENKAYSINPSYLSPYAYRIFAEADTKHDWNSIVNSSYEILQKCTLSTLGKNKSSGIPPDWCAIDEKGNVVNASNIDGLPSNYSFDAIRTLWRIALDYTWYKDSRALNYLQSMTIWSKEWKEKQKIYSSYTHDGQMASNEESLAHYGTQLAFFTITDKKIADEIYKKKILSQWNKEGYWGDRNNYYDQNWVWFGTALYTNNLPNLWVNKK